MTYEFNPDTQSLELPNPYKIENISLLISGTMACGGGLICLFRAARAIAQEATPSALLTTAIATMLLGLGAWLLARAMQQLRFFFGRNRPQSLAAKLEPEVQGDSPQALHIKEVLRHNALIFVEPHGALNGVLYSILPTLIFAPAAIQRAAQRQFQNLLGLSAISLSYLLSWYLTRGSPASGWVGLAYAAMAVCCIHPMRDRAATSFQTNGEQGALVQIGSRGLLALLVCSVLGPALVGRLLHSMPGLGNFSVNGVVLISLALAMGAIGTFLMALGNQLSAAPQEVGVARVVETVTMNAHPAKLMEQLDRTLMNEWFSRIPNRRYSYLAPKVHGGQGQFRAEVLEETQPQPKPATMAKDWSHAMGEPYFRWLLYLTGLATACLSGGVCALVLVSLWMLDSQTFGESLALALCLLCIGLYAQDAAHQLWGRFDFVSRLIWVEITGSFESAQVHIGNQLTANVHSAKNVFNVEQMTLRVWVSEIETVIFGKDAPRQLTRIRGLQGKADELTTNLKLFAESCSMVVAPTAPADIERAQRIKYVNQLVSGLQIGANLSGDNGTSAQAQLFGNSQL